MAGADSSDSEAILGLLHMMQGPIYLAGSSDAEEVIHPLQREEGDGLGRPVGEEVLVRDRVHGKPEEVTGVRLAHSTRASPFHFNGGLGNNGAFRRTGRGGWW